MTNQALTPPTLTGFPLGPYRLRGVKHLNTSRGVAWSGALTHDGSAIGSVENFGDGGMTRIRIGSIADKSTFNAFLTSIIAALVSMHAERFKQAAQEFDLTLPETLPTLDTPSEREEVFGECLADEAHLQKAVSRHLAKATVYRLAEDANDAFNLMDRLYTPEVGEQLRARYGERLVWIANELNLSGNARKTATGR